MKPWSRIRGTSILSYVILTFSVVTLTLLVSRDGSLEGIQQQKIGGRSVRDPRYTLFLINELYKEWNATGPLLAVNITNIIQLPKEQGQDLLALHMGGALSKGRNHQETRIDINATTETKSDNQMLQHFLPAMTILEQTRLFDALSKLTAVCEKENFTYMMYSGTLLGSYRHHGIVPWDDDFDMIMEYSKREDIVEALSRCGANYEIWVAGARVKFYSASASKTSRYPWKWPYIDISFYKENFTHIWDGSMEDDYGDRAYVYQKSKVFPLHKRPLGRFFVNSPYDAYDNLRRTYSRGALKGCMTSHYSHKHENLTAQTYKVPCWVLSKHYPFVHREPADGGGIKETLRKGNDIIQTLIVQEPAYAITKPYEVVLLKPSQS